MCSFVVGEMQMRKIVNYIKFGRGIGASWLFLYALIGAIIFGVMCRSLGYVATPALQNVADQLLPIKVENGVIVEPENVIKAVKFESEDLGQFPVVLDTTVDAIDTVNLASGIYISKVAVYFVEPQKTTMQYFRGSVDLPKEDYTDLFKKMSVYGGLIMGVFALFVLFIVYLILTAFYALFALGWAKIYKVFFSYQAAMRMSALAYIATSLLVMLLGLCGLGVPTWLFFIAVVALLGIGIKMLYVNEKPTKSVYKI